MKKQSKDKKERYNKFRIMNKPMMDIPNIMAIGAYQLKGDWIASRFDLSYFKKVIKALEALEMDKTWDNIDLFWSKDMPCVIGLLDKKSNIVTGFAIAPKIIEED
jgi:hypothetical protein